jgi:hypothetical protein
VPAFLKRPSSIGQYGVKYKQKKRSACTENMRFYNVNLRNQELDTKVMRSGQFMLKSFEIVRDYHEIGG